MTDGPENKSQPNRSPGAPSLVAISVLLSTLGFAFAQLAAPKPLVVVPLSPLPDSPPVRDAVIRTAIDRGCAFLADKDFADDTVLARSLRIIQEPASDIAADVAWLISQQQDNGGWGFGPDHPHTRSYPAWTDITNTQLAVAALRAARDAGANVPNPIFARTLTYCLAARNSDGGWGLSPPDAKPLRLRAASHGSTTAAALNILFDSLPTDRPADVEQLRPIVDGLRWLLDDYAVDRVPGWQWGAENQPLVAYLWLMQRLVDVGGMCRLGEHCIRDDVVRQLLALQGPDGSWGRGDLTAADTAMAVHALAGTRRPVLINRLAGNFDSACETVNFLRYVRTRYLHANADQYLTWQRIGPDLPHDMLAEAPILFIIAVGELNFPPSAAAKFLRHVESGGTIIVQFTQPDDDSFQRAAKYFADILPAWRARPLAEFPAALSAAAELPPQVVQDAIGIGDNIRLAVAVLPVSVQEALSAGYGRDTAESFDLMTNLAAVASGSSTPMGRPPYLLNTFHATFSPQTYLSLARVQHTADWQVCPFAFRRISDTLAAALSIGVKELPPCDLFKPVAGDIPLLWLTGTESIQLNKAQQRNLTAYLQSGGTLMVESAVGDQSFGRSVETVLTEMFGQDFLTKFPDDHPIITGRFGGGMGSDLTSVTYSPDVLNPPAGAELYGIDFNGRPAVIFCRFGLLAAAEGGPVLPGKSLCTDDARRLAANILLYLMAEDR